MAPNFQKLHFLLQYVIAPLVILSEQRGAHVHVHLVSAHDLRNEQKWSSPTKLFVFGDSYADTGNVRKIANASSWKVPYGITFPGKPAGRFSDGLVLTDYIAKYVGVKSPIPYRWRRFLSRRVQYGMNFACGGTGVFSAFSLDPNMTTQIDYFQKLIKESVYTSQDLTSSLVLVSLAGNDYNGYVARNGSPDQSFINSVVKQLIVNIRKIHGLGVRKIVVTGIGSIGCLPAATAATLFQQCNQVWNDFARYHNKQLSNDIYELNHETKNSSSSFFILGLYEAFMNVLQEKSPNERFLKLYKPCCLGVSNATSCGKVDANGKKEYYVCDEPESAFFWDLLHPTQAGWRAVFNQLQGTLQQILPIKNTNA